MAEDYLKAGLLDRAEAYLKQLADRPAYRREALERLVLIYEQEREWEQAIAIRDRLADETHTGRSPVVAHYFCELAQKALAGDNPEQALEYLRRARAADRDNLRGAILRAGIAERRRRLQAGIPALSPGDGAGPGIRAAHSACIATLP